MSPTADTMHEPSVSWNYVLNSAVPQAYAKA